MTYYTSKLVVAFVFVFSFAQVAKAQFTITPGQTAADLVQAMTGQNVIVTNPVLTCHDSANAVFSYTDTALHISDGIILMTGYAAQINNPWNFALNHQNGNGGDSLLTAIVGFGTYDACKLEFDVEAAYDTLFLRYVMGSDEYPEYSCSYFGDRLGFFISGGIYSDSNFALVPDTTLFVGTGSIGCPYDTLSFQYFIDNQVQGDTSIAFDGYTHPLEAWAYVTPGTTYHLKIIIGDISDMVFDSGILIEGGSLGSKNALSVANVENDKNRATVYPNPFSDHISVRLPDELQNKNVEVHIMNLLGQDIYHYTGKGNGLNQALKNNIKQLGTGIYTMSLLSENSSQVMKFQKN